MSKRLIRDLRREREEGKDTKEAAAEGEVVQMQLTVTFEVGCWGGGVVVVVVVVVGVGDDEPLKLT